VLEHKLERGQEHIWVLELELVLGHMLELELGHILELGLELVLGHMLVQVLELVLEHRLGLVQVHILAEEQVCSWSLVARQGQQLPRQRRQGSVGQEKD
jgi:hypothetical protein